MGMDMSMFIVKDKHILADDIFEGRNSLVQTDAGSLLWRK